MRSHLFVVPKEEIPASLIQGVHVSQSPSHLGLRLFRLESPCTQDEKDMCEVSYRHGQFPARRPRGPRITVSCFCHWPLS